MEWWKRDYDSFGFTNQELLPEGSWTYIDEWRFTRAKAAS